MNYEGFITQSLQKASVVANNQFGKVAGVTKEGDNNQVLTQADLEIGQLIVNSIKEVFPSHNIIDEEAGVIDNKSEYTWVIDPIDGTSNFANGIPLYGTMIGLLKDTYPIAGGIGLPFFKEIYVAEKGKGAFLANKKLQVTSEKNLLNTLVAYHIDGHQEDPEYTKEEANVLADIVLDIRNLRIFETCYDSALLARGKIGGFLNKTSKIWDNVAPQIIIEEAGGMYTDFYGTSLDYSSPLAKAKDNFTVCAAPPALHKQLQKIVHNAS